MHVYRLLSVAGAALLIPVLVSAGGDSSKPIAVDLATFEFKVPKDKEALFSHNVGEDKLAFYANGSGETKIKIPKDGAYEIAVKASGDKALMEGAKFKVSLDGKQLGKETETSDGEPKEFKFATALKSGERILAIAFTNDVFKEGEYDRNLYVHAVTVSPVK
jgi:hypothetical protein